MRQEVQPSITEWRRTSVPFPSPFLHAVAIWEGLRAANFHGSTAAPWQPTRSGGGLGEQRQRRKDISLRDFGVFVPARKALGGLQEQASGQVHSGRASPMDAHSAEDLSLNQTAAFQQSLLVSPDPKWWVQVCLRMGG